MPSLRLVRRETHCRVARGSSVSVGLCGRRSMAFAPRYACPDCWLSLNGERPLLVANSEAVFLGGSAAMNWRHVGRPKQNQCSILIGCDECFSIDANGSGELT